MESQEGKEEGICIASLDGGGPGTMSQLRMIDEFMIRLAYERDVDVEELRPADYFDMMGGVGFGGLAALLLGRLRMSTGRAMEELSTIGTVTFPKGNEMFTPEVNVGRLQQAVESMLRRNGHPVDMELRDTSSSRCKVVLFAATTAVMDYCQPFRTYRSPRKCLNCTFVEAVCAILATPEFFPPFAIGPPLRKQTFAGIPLGFDNPTREVLKEARLAFGDKRRVSLVLSLGSGQRARLSDLDHHITRRSRIHSDTVARELQDQLNAVGEYLRLNVDRGMAAINVNDWWELGSIETFTNVYLEMAQVTQYIDEASQWLLQRNGSVTLGQLTGTNDDCIIKFHSEKLKDYFAMEFKQMHEIVREIGIEKIILVDAIGRYVPIPLEFCLTYSMLSEVIEVYFKHQSPPGSDFVERGDYRLVHGSRRNIVGPLEWARIDKPGLKVEMSIVLRTRNSHKSRCPRCRTWFEGRVIDGWAQCLSCSGQFQIETQTQVETQDQSDGTSLFEDRPTMAPGRETPTVSESRNNSRSETSARQVLNGEEDGQLQFRLISVINLLQRKVNGEHEDMNESHFRVENETERRPFTDLLMEPFDQWIAAFSGFQLRPFGPVPDTEAFSRRSALRAENTVSLSRVFIETPLKNPGLKSNVEVIAMVFDPPHILGGPSFKIFVPGWYWGSQKLTSEDIRATLRREAEARLQGRPLEQAIMRNYLIELRSDLDYCVRTLPAACFSLAAPEDVSLSFTTSEGWIVTREVSESNLKICFARQDVKLDVPVPSDVLNQTPGTAQDWVLIQLSM